MRIVKVKAHQDLTKVGDPLQRWIVQGNSAADQNAKQAPILRVRKQKEEQQKTALQDLIKYHDYLVEIQTEVLKVELPQKAETSNAEWQPQCHRAQIRPNPSLEAAVRCPFGAEFCWRVVQWASQLRWCPPHCPSCVAALPEQALDVSYLELLLDFRIYTHSDVPVNVTTPAERAEYKIPRYELRDHHVRADALGNPLLAVQSRTWICFLKWAEKQQMGLFPAGHKSKARSAAKFGYSRLLQGLDRRPELATGSQAFQYLLQYFRASSGPNKNLDKVLDIPATAKKLQECPQQYCLPYKDLASNCKMHRR